MAQRYSSKTIDETIAKKSVVRAEDFFIARTPFENLKEKTMAEITAFHGRESLGKGISRETLREKIYARIAPEIFRAVLSSLETDEKIIQEKDFVRAASHNVSLSADEKFLFEKLKKIYADAKLEVPALDSALSQAIQNTKLKKEQARKVFQLFLDSGEIIKVTVRILFSAGCFE